MLTKFRVEMQLAEARGETNRWFCSQHHQRPVHDDETLMIYFIRSGGAADFAFRFAQAMGKENRWFCSEFYGREIRDPEILWNYYMTYRAQSCATGSQALAFSR